MQNKFWKPEEKLPGVNLERGNVDQLVTITQNKKLPITDKSSGKTTQVPVFLHEASWTAGNKSIACTQPNRLATISIANKVASDRNCTIGTEVGYKVRFDHTNNLKSSSTKILFLTDGELFRELLEDPFLNKFSVIILDELHERSIFQDLNLTLIKKVLGKRDDLRVVISSATLDAIKFQKFFNEDKLIKVANEKKVAEILSVEGRHFPVYIQYLMEPCLNYIETLIETVKNIHKFENVGDILVFLSEKDEVEDVVSLLNEISGSLYAVPLYSGLTVQEQLKTLERAPSGNRKVIVSTSVAETSVTIDERLVGVVYVIDSGLTKLKVFDPKSGLESHITTTISKANADQRAGRAGRTRPGKVFRLYTEDTYYKFANNIIPEIQRSNLASAVLSMKALGIENVARFDYISPPPSKLIIHSLELLYSLKAVDDYGRLTIPFGMNIAESPINPMISTMLLSSEKLECGEEALSIAAMLLVQNVFLTPSGYRKEAEKEKIKYSVEEGDHITLLNVFNSFIQSKQSQRYCQQNYLNHKSLNRAYQIRQKLKIFLVNLGIKIKSCKGDTEVIRKCILSGFFSQVAEISNDGSYRSVRDKELV
ncbi:ATPdependent RNA helicase [Clydaea vesicula]|uniref:ATPdependent RNA helicase n=1 Tax=Clydaea vesicula TaxID=447962 RepID=A0AAD5XYT3_9FUNG|nr:ATPdependent RNA helicase [Clydaea vesicula]